jgi:hypothetical protein
MILNNNPRLNIDLSGTPIRPSELDQSGTLYYCYECECYLATNLDGTMGLFRHVRMHRLINLRMREREIQNKKLPFSGVVSPDSNLRILCPHEKDVENCGDMCYGYCKGLRRN